MKNGNGADPGGKTEVREPRFKLIPFDELRPVTRPAYLVKDIIPRTGIIVVWGPPKCGKSFWMTTVMFYVALGWEYRGHKVVQGAVVYCAFEGQDGYGQRAEALRQRHLPEDADPVPFFLVAAQMNLVKDHVALVEAIKLQLGNTMPVAVVLDTLNRSLHGSESEDKDMAAYIQAATVIREAFNCAVIIIHHCGVSGDRPRGHTSLTGAADGQIAVKRDGAGYVVATVEWMMDGPEGATIASKLEQVEVGVDDDGDAITSCVVLPVEDRPAEATPTSKARLPKAAQIALRALGEAIEECGEEPPASNHIPDKVKTVTEDRWRQYAYRRGISTGEGRAKQQAFKRAHAHLIASQHVGEWDGQIWLAK
jgi:AAA domain